MSTFAAKADPDGTNPLQLGAERTERQNSLMFGQEDLQPSSGAPALTASEAPSTVNKRP